MKREWIVAVVLSVAFLATIAIQRCVHERRVDALTAAHDQTVLAYSDSLEARDREHQDHENLLEQKDSVIQHTVMLYAAAEEQRAALQTRSTQLNTAVQQLRDELSTTQAAYNLTKEDLRFYSALTDTLSAEVGMLTMAVSSQREKLADYAAYTVELEPHLVWLQNEANRNWWEKLWDRDKLPKPSTPLPLTPSPPPLY